MAGELWREKAQIGKETTYGVAVAATRIIYGRDLQLTRERPPRRYSFATGTRDRVRAQTLGSVRAGGQVVMPMSADELVEWLLVGVKGAVTPTTPGGFTSGRQWDFTPGTSLDSLTMERDDGAKTIKGTGIYVNRYRIAGSVAGANDVTMELFAKERSTLGALTGSLTERTPTFMEGWEARMYLDSFGGTPGTTQISAALIAWDIDINNNLGRKYTADNTQAPSSVTTGDLEITGSLTLEATASQIATEITNWDNETQRLLRLEFGMNEVIDTGTNEVQTITITGSPTGGTFTLTFKGQTTGTIAYNATAATVQAALEALGAIGAGNVTCGGGPFPGTAVTATFAGNLAGLDVPQMTAAHAFTGGASPAISVSTTTAGAGSKRAVFLDIPLAWMEIDFNSEDEGTRAYKFNFGYVFDTTNAFGYRWRLWNNRTAAFN